MSSHPIDEDGFHSIAWDDAPPAQSFSPSSPLTPKANSAQLGRSGGGGGGGGPSDTASENGFETISPPPESATYGSGFNTRQGGQGPSSPESRNHPGTVRGEREHAEVDAGEWGGRWMVVQVRDPVKEHEGSKDMYVSYAVKTMVSEGAWYVVCSVSTSCCL